MSSLKVEIPGGQSVSGILPRNKKDAEIRSVESLGWTHTSAPRERLTTMTETIEDRVQAVLDDNDFEDLLEQFDVTRLEAFMLLLNSGLIDNEQFEEIYYG